MKILIVSDTHGHSENLEKVLEQTGPLDQSERGTGDLLCPVYGREYFLPCKK